ncbi:RNase adapter RapZ [Novosphingopyxis sp.]|uniref:RNase adapter RapZ n=1 Tax=Novosphingopyxis sp. TaxID=2709690 RepID=UPI003B590E44
MTERAAPKTILLVTGLSGAGKSTALNQLEDLGWETVDNLPIRLVGRLLKTPPAEGQERGDVPLALGFDSRTRGFAPEDLVDQVKKLQKAQDVTISTLFLDCQGAELGRRFAETRRPHPLALDRPAADGIAEERSLMEPLRRWADTVIDTTGLAVNDLKTLVRERFEEVQSRGTTLSVTSFGFSRGVPHNADLIFDLRFLRNPHWIDKLRPLTGLDAAVGDYVRADTDFDEAFAKIRELVLFLLPRYESEGKAYVNIAFGCTGGRHRSVFFAESFARMLQEEGYAPSIGHRNLASRPVDSLENFRDGDRAGSSLQEETI